jgi:hypothetical protein
MLQPCTYREDTARGAPRHPTPWRRMGVWCSQLGGSWGEEDGWRHAGGIIIMYRLIVISSLPLPKGKGWGRYGTLFFEMAWALERGRIQFHHARFGLRISDHVSFCTRPVKQTMPCASAPLGRETALSDIGFSLSLALEELASFRLAASSFAHLHSPPAWLTYIHNTLD